MTKFQNMKIEINEQQPLDEVVRKLERLGYKKFAWSFYKETVMVVTYGDSKWFTDHNKSINRDNLQLTTLAQLKAMEK